MTIAVLDQVVFAFANAEIQLPEHPGPTKQIIDATLLGLWSEEDLAAVWRSVTWVTAIGRRSRHRARLRHHTASACTPGGSPRLRRFECPNRAPPNPPQPGTARTEGVSLRLVNMVLDGRANSWTPPRYRPAP